MNQTFLELLAEIKDFRKGNAIHYRLQDILLVSVLAVICNMDTYTEMVLYHKT
ncbi:MAG: transposase family protein [Synergistes jonesii]|uniref:transposase family protein n=1 Tax=Synergistes jonesii TaxID=2754 RepID=UPI002A74BC53|nr:transposase family protein [Synergistes jonesii]MDY2984884.1 transposase family protein [Synergistes jonesii]